MNLFLTALNVQEIMSIILGSLGALCLLVLIVLLIKVIVTVSRVNNFIDDIEKPAAEIVKAVPDILEPTTTIVKGVADTVPDILTDVQSVTSDVASVADSFTDFIDSKFSKHKKKSFGDESEGVAAKIARFYGVVAGITSIFKRKNKKKNK